MCSWGQGPSGQGVGGGERGTGPTASYFPKGKSGTAMLLPQGPRDTGLGAPVNLVTLLGCPLIPHSPILWQDRGGDEGSEGVRGIQRKEAEFP